MTGVLIIVTCAAVSANRFPVAAVAAVLAIIINM